MATRRMKPLGRIRRSPLFRVLERVILSIGMTIVAFFVERQLIKAIEKGGMKAPRTAEERHEFEQTVTPSPAGSEGELTASAQ